MLCDLARDEVEGDGFDEGGSELHVVDGALEAPCDLGCVTSAIEHAHVGDGYLVDWGLCMVSGGGAHRNIHTVGVPM